MKQFSVWLASHEEEAKELLSRAQFRCYTQGITIQIIDREEGFIYYEVR